MHDENTSNIPDFVRGLLVGDRLERVEEDIRRLIGPSKLGCVHRVDIVADPRDVTALIAATTIGGPNDPTKDGAEKPWLSLIARLLGHEAEEAGRAARDWYRALLAANVATEEPVPHRAIAAYLAGVIGAYARHDVRAEYWLEVGHVESEFDGKVWEPLFEACRFVRGAVRAGG